MRGNGGYKQPSSIKIGFKHKFYDFMACSRDKKKIEMATRDKNICFTK